MLNNNGDNTHPCFTPLRAYLASREVFPSLQNLYITNAAACVSDQLQRMQVVHAGTVFTEAILFILQEFLARFANFIVYRHADYLRTH